MSASPDNRIHVRLMTPSDIPFADSIRALAGWNQTNADWERFLSCEASGCFLAESDGAPAGTAACTRYGTELAWIGMLLVHPERRRRGIASALMQQCLSYLETRGVACVKLDATPLGKPLYDRFGFQPECSLTRWELENAFATPARSSVAAAACSDADWDAILDLDRRAFGYSRCELLNALRKNCRRIVVHAPDGNGGFGYGFLRNGSRACYLGPVAAHDPATAGGIIRQLLASVPSQAVFWDVLDQNQDASALAQTLGFTPQRRLLRMFRGPNPGLGDPNLQFAIVDPATG